MNTRTQSAPAGILGALGCYRAGIARTLAAACALCAAPDEWAGVLEDLKALLGPPPALPVHYPRPTRRFDPKRPQFEWFVGDKKRREWFVKKKSGRTNAAENKDPVTLPLARQDTAGLPLMDREGKHVKGN